MKKLLDNFLYIALRRNLSVALFITWHEIRRGSKYKINTIETADLDDLTIVDGDKTKSSRYEALNYYILETLLGTFCKLFPHEKNIVDVGSGKGRVMIVAAHYGFKNITGIDFAKELCDSANQNIRKIQGHFPHTTFTIHCSDILNYNINASDKVYFLFNPFNKEIMEKFLEKIDASVSRSPRTIYFMYANPLYKNLFLEKGYREIFSVKKLGLLEGVILVR